MSTCICFKGDPTKTVGLRKRFVSQFRQRFNAIKYASNKSIVDNDCFGLKDPIPASVSFVERTLEPPSTSWKTKISPIPYNQFKFDRDPDKINNFMKWLNASEEASLFQIVRFPRPGMGIENIWSDIYIYDAYKRGVLFGIANIKKDHELMKDLNLTPEELNTASADLDTAMKLKVHADRVGTLYTRVYTDLKGITATMDAQISRELATGLISGESPFDIAKKIANRVNAIGIHRATVLARTEVIRAHHMASIQAYRNFEVENVKVEAEWLTAGDELVCELCDPLQGKKFTLDEIEGKIPVHPQCRCAALPVVI